MRRICTSWLIVLGLAACGDDLPDPPPGQDSADSTSTGPPSADSTSTIPESSTSSTSSAGITDTTSTSAVNTFGEVDDCQGSGDCDEGLYCVAPFDESLGPQGKGLNECVAECVGIMDETKWCADAAACCDPTAECTDRGYCVFPSESTGGPNDTDTDTTGTGTTGG